MLSGNDCTNERLEGSWSCHTNVFALIYPYESNNYVCNYIQGMYDCKRCESASVLPWSTITMEPLASLDVATPCMAYTPACKQGSNDYVSRVTDIRFWVSVRTQTPLLTIVYDGKCPRYCPAGALSVKGPAVPYEHLHLRLRQMLSDTLPFSKLNSSMVVVLCIGCCESLLARRLLGSFPTPRTVQSGG